MGKCCAETPNKVELVGACVVRVNVHVWVRLVSSTIDHHFLRFLSGVQHLNALSNLMEQELHISSVDDEHMKGIKLDRVFQIICPFLQLSHFQSLFDSTINS